MKEHDLFLEEYKKLESNTRECLDLQVKEYEDKLINDKRLDDAEKLRYCRNARNFLSHHQDAQSFVSISKDMQSFISLLNQELSEKDTPVKKKMITVSKALLDSCNISEAAQYLQKKKISVAPYFNKNGTFVGIINQDAICSLVADGKSIKTTKLSSLPVSKTQLSKVQSISDTDTISTIFGAPKSTLFLVKNEKGAIVGFIVS